MKNFKSEKFWIGFFVKPHLCQFLSPTEFGLIFCHDPFVTIFESVRFQSGVGVLLWHKFRDILKSVRFQCRVGKVLLIYQL